MRIDVLHKFKLDNITLIASLPDMGKVGGIVTEHIAKKMGAVDAGTITLSDKPWVNQKDGIIETPTDNYRFLVDEKNGLVVFTGESQPQESNAVIDLAENVLNTTLGFGKVNRVITAGGYMPMQRIGGDEVYCVATSSHIIEKLKNHSIGLLDSDVKSITWFNGLILGAAKARGIDGIGLFGEIQDMELPQYRAARNIVNKIERILDLKIGTDELDQKIQVRTTEIKKDGPGIG
jgi:proteasome assembly chaperone (PAC2) family protein